MKVIIAGGRDYCFTDRDIDRLDGLHAAWKITEVVSGGALGADAWGEAWAKTNGIPIKLFPADWKKHGKSAGPIRNQAMADYADAVILFPGGRGTADMKKKAEAKKLTVVDWRSEGVIF